MSDDQPEPLGRGTFSLEGRPAPGLYLLGWLLSGVGFGLLIVALQATGSIASWLLLGSVLLLIPGLALAAGYQIVARARRAEVAYRGPSPLILFALQLILANLLSVVFLAFGLPDPRTSLVGFAGIAAILLFSYVAVVWLFVLRSGALSWRDMRLPVGAPLGRVLGDVGLGGVAMLLLWPLVTGLAALLAVLLQTSTPDPVFPPPSVPVDILLTIVAAAILVPIGEEIFFRGFALTAWLRDRGPRSALIRSTAFFALVHALNINVTLDAAGAFEGAKQALLTVVVIAPVGAALGWLFLRRGLVASIAGHATFNLISVVLLTLSTYLPQPG
jgi:CAAX protease family protein